MGYLFFLYLSTQLHRGSLGSLWNDDFIVANMFLSNYVNYEYMWSSSFHSAMIVLTYRGMINYKCIYLFVDFYQYYESYFSIRCLFIIFFVILREWMFSRLFIKVLQIRGNTCFGNWAEQAVLGFGMELILLSSYSVRMNVICLEKVILKRSRYICWFLQSYINKSTCCSYRSLIFRISIFVKKWISMRSVRYFIYYSKCSFLQ